MSLFALEAHGDSQEKRFYCHREKNAKLKGKYLRAEGNRHTKNFSNMTNKLAALYYIA